MNHPDLGSTYRIQVQALGFDQTRRLVPYLATLGIQTLYLAPVFAAAPGSSHGYDVIDPGRLDPDLGTEEELDDLFDELEARGMRALLDIVPNHMAAVPENGWWWDVLRLGEDSLHAPTFDIHWSEHQGRVLVPVLTRPLADVLRAGALEVDQTNGEITVDGIRFPLGASPPDGDDADVLRYQHYRPAYWRTSATLGNYRRFFDINSLVGVRVEDPDVFGATHALIAQLCSRAAVAGVRVDHVDGLMDPAQYLDRLRDLLRDNKTIVIEKILGQAESVVARWPVDGTSGYEFADRVMALFVDPAGAARLRAAGEALCGMDDSSFATLSRRGKREALEQSFCAELDYLTRLSIEALDAESPGHDLSEHDLRRAWTEVTVALPVYRTYIDDRGTSDADVSLIDAVSAMPPDHPEVRRAAETVLRALREDARAGSPWLVIAQRWQQLSGAAMAKGCEDTATYRYPGLLARAEVGGDPDAGDDGVDRFHAFATQRVGGLNATSTHDSKRNEDARCRLAVLSEADSEWMTLVHRWSAFCPPNDVAPHPTEVIAIFQSLLSLWPAAGDELDEVTLARIVQQATKAARESGLRTSWSDPDERYEDGIARFIRGLHQDTAFRSEMTEFSRTIGPAAFVNSLASLVLKVCAPGTPDFYQGTELVEPTLTDPDNRRPVDFAARAQVLATLPDPSISAAHDLLSHWTDGHLKIYVMRTLLHDRGRFAPLYARGSYEPLPTTTRHVVAFRRDVEGDGALICVVPRLTYHLAGPGTLPTGRQRWKDHVLNLPVEGPSRYRELLTDRLIEPRAGGIFLSDALEVLPVAVLRAAA
ncbi:MAG TPA: malto-oligosyltrehalose synthase [Acidimicrobiales bacterium]|nr:malto-oligosyltrehalose synthase [Acidimicrobiales bacterium]